MTVVYDEAALLPFLQDRLFPDGKASGVLEALINKDGLHNSILMTKTRTKALFTVDRAETSEGPPRIDRLALVLPQSFQVSWKLRVSGHLLVRYGNIQKALPRPIPPFDVIYSAVLVPGDFRVDFKNERVLLVEKQ